MKYSYEILRPKNDPSINIKSLLRQYSAYIKCLPKKRNLPHFIVVYVLCIEILNNKKNLTKCCSLKKTQKFG